MSTPEISAPMVGERGWTLTEVARVTGQFCPSAGADGCRIVARRPAYIGPHRTAACRQKGPSMSDDTGGLVLTPPARNYSPWYQWMTRLAATTHEDPLPEGDPAAIAGLAGAPPRPLAELLGPEPAPGPAQRRDARVGGLRRLPPGQDRLRHRGHHVGAGLPARPRRPRTAAPPGRPCWPATATGRASPRWSAWSTPTCPTPTTGCSWSAAATWCWRRTCAASASAWTGTPRTTTPATPIWSTPPWRAGTRWPRTSGTCGARLDVLEQHPLVDPARLGMVGISYGGTVTLFTAAVDSRVSRRRVVSGYFSSWAESHKMPWNMCGSQIMFGMLGRLEHEDLGALVAPRPLLVESGTEDDSCSRSPRPPSRCAGPVSSTSSWVRPIAWCTTSSRAGTSGTAPRPCPSSTAGSATAGLTPRRPRRRLTGPRSLGPLSRARRAARPRLGGLAQHLVERGLGADVAAARHPALGAAGARAVGASASAGSRCSRR